MEGVGQGTTGKGSVSCEGREGNGMAGPTYNKNLIISIRMYSALRTQ